MKKIRTADVRARRLIPLLPLLAGLAATSFAGGCQAASVATKDLLLATTTSTQDSGLLDALIPMFEEQTDYRVKTIAVGTGKALAMAKQGVIDVVLVHAPAREKALVDEGYTVHRRVVMHNDFLIAGPQNDEAGVNGLRDGSKALRRIAQSKARFVSRGDDSGTHSREKALWRGAGIQHEGKWYVESGQGMGATLMIASEMNAYTLTDRGTYLAMKDKLALVPRVEGDKALLNVYSVMEVNPARFPKVNHQGARAFGDFMVSAAVQAFIRDFGVDKFGQPLFVPDAGKDESKLGE